MTRKPVQIIVKGGFFVSLTYFVLCNDGAMFWAQPEEGKPIRWVEIPPIPQE